MEAAQADECIDDFGAGCIGAFGFERVGDEGGERAGAAQFAHQGYCGHWLREPLAGDGEVGQFEEESLADTAFAGVGVEDCAIGREPSIVFL